VKSLTFIAGVGAIAALAGCGGLREPQGATPPMALAQRSIGSAYRVLYSFRDHADGMHPLAGVIVVNGALYGTTLGGGSTGAGTVYRVTTTGREKVLHSFGRGTDGVGPRAALIDVDGTLYGTTNGGGKFRNGTVYSITTSGVEKVLYSFSGGRDGASPEGGLIDVGGALYGTTAEGGGGCGYGCGTVYRISTTGDEKVLYRFKGGPTGAELPEASLRDVGGVLYGTTYLGGGRGCRRYAGCGTAFSVTRSGAERLLHRFAGRSDGSNPFAALTSVDGVLYGTAVSGGGSSHAGTAFRLTTSGSDTVLHRFSVLHSGGVESRNWVGSSERRVLRDDDRRWVGRQRHGLQYERGGPRHVPARLRRRL